MREKLNPAVGPGSPEDVGMAMAGRAIATAIALAIYKAFLDTWEELKNSPASRGQERNGNGC